MTAIVSAELVRSVLSPLAGPDPAGGSVREDPIYGQIREALREEEDLPQGAWQRSRKVADHPLAIRLATQVLATRSKDLQVAVWLTEALLRRDGIPGLRDGLAVLRGLVEQFWDGVHPPLEDGDPVLRAGPLEYVGLKLGAAVRAAPVTAARHSFTEHADAELAGTEAEAKSDAGRARQRKALVDRQRPVLEDVAKAVEATPKAFYRALDTAFAESLAHIAALEALADARFPEDPPSFRVLRETLDAYAPVAARLLAEKLATDPDPATPEASAGAPAEGAGDAADAADPGSDGAGTLGGAARAAAGGEAEVAPLVGATPSLAPRPTGRDDALARVAAAARWLRAAAPTDPTAYLLMRGLRWGELRTARGIRGAPAPALLEAPPTAVRARLKGLLMEERWSALLDGVEELLSEPHGRAWLDAQRYTLAACAALGEEYDAVARGVRSALRALLADFPGLPRATLLDDAPAANPETLAWLEAEGLWQTGAAAEASVFPGALAGSYAPGAPFAGEAGGRDGSEDRTGRRAPLERARAERAAGRPERGVELLARELARERSARARFLRKTEIATVLVESDLHRVAQPILEELLDQIEAHKLEQWEEGGVVAAPMVLMCRTLEAVKGDAALRQKLYLRVCRLDPVAALAVGTA